MILLSSIHEVKTYMAENSIELKLNDNEATTDTYTNEQMVISIGNDNAEVYQLEGKYEFMFIPNVGELHAHFVVITGMVNEFLYGRDGLVPAIPSKW